MSRPIRKILTDPKPTLLASSGEGHRSSPVMTDYRDFLDSERVE
jgi:hypothetical protein